jgi:uncharacterized C2H2 Zn-finger protein
MKCSKCGDVFSYSKKYIKRLDRIQYKCPDCGYTWYEKPLDYNEGASNNKEELLLEEQWKSSHTEKS